jgi:hypothetical protein
MCCAECCTAEKLGFFGASAAPVPFLANFFEGFVDNFACP